MERLDAPPRAKRSRRSHLAREIVETLAITLLIFLAIHFTVQNYQISGISMQNTLHDGQFVLVNRIAYLFRPPQRGDVIVFHDPTNPGRDLIKRIIGIPGDTITLDSHTVTVDGVQLNEPYIAAKFNPSATTSVVPAGKYFVMGDNRQNSYDSRYWGLLPKDFIVGKAIGIYWPLNQWKWIDTYTSVYAQIK